MIIEDYVSFETAKLLKEKGFDEKCPCSYRKKLVDNKIVDEEELFVSAHLMLTNSELEDKVYRDIVYCSAPTLQMAMKWLREVHKLYMYTAFAGMEEVWFSRIYDKDKHQKDLDNFNTYEEACEAAIKYCLENLI